jgi:alanyl aminopeptidase
VPWQLTLTVDAGDLAASNAPIVHEQVAGRFKDVEFAETAPLPSYLIAFAVGPFEVIDSATTASGVPIRVLAPPALVEGARPAAAVAADVDFFERWLGVPFPYPKLDVIVAPRGGPRWSAMENPGLVTIDSRMRGSAWATTMAHEVAHHWFGDLVTPAWWDDIWLNESFALWAGAKATGDARGFAATRLPAIPPATDAAHPEALDPEYFRGSRGAAVLAALERSIGPAAMQRAVHDYLTGHANGTVTTADFIAAVARASDRPAAGELTAELHTR